MRNDVIHIYIKKITIQRKPTRYDNYHSGATGDIYFGMYDTQTDTTGTREFYFTPSSFTYPIPEGAQPWALD